MGEVSARGPADATALASGGFRPGRWRHPFASLGGTTDRCLDRVLGPPTPHNAVTHRGRPDGPRATWECFDEGPLLVRRRDALLPPRRRRGRPAEPGPGEGAAGEAPVRPRHA